MPPEQLSINGLDMTTPGWKVLDHTPLMEEAETSGTNRRLPAGRVRSYPRYRTETIKDLPMLIWGSHDRLGAVYANPNDGLRLNIEEINAALGPVSAGDGTRAAIWTLPDGTTRGARVHASLELGEREVAICRAMLILVLPDGRFL